MLLGFYERRRADGFEAGMQFALQRLLSDPEFLFRIERDPAGAAPGSAYPVSALTLASRLSFFLWSSIPDEELLDAAIRGDLGDPALLEVQVRRMLRDPRSRALVDNFAGQWLLLRNIPTVQPDPILFPTFDENLRTAFRRESELFVESIMREDRSVVDLIAADYTFVDERLAAHYGIPGVYGSRFRKVTLDGRRGGLLGHGGLLTVTSYPNRTSPVLRGKWVLENLLGAPPPPPPPDVPSFPERGDGGEPATVRELLEMHRRNPACAGCHAPMDPPRVRAGAVRRDRPLADHRRAGADRRARRDAHRRRLRRPVRVEGDAGQQSRAAGADRDREAAGVCARPRHRIP